MTRFAGTCVDASVAVSVVMLFFGSAGAWPIVAYDLAQSVLSDFYEYITVNNERADIKGVKATA